MRDKSFIGQDFGEAGIAPSGYEAFVPDADFRRGFCKVIPMKSSAFWRGRLAVIQGDITHFPADAIVNAASQSLLGAAGLSGVLLAAGGPELRQECVALGGCTAGEAKVTQAGRLPARHVIHAVGPVWYDGIDGEETTLARCYERCLSLVEQYGHRTVAFPSISTGAHGFPLERAARIALGAITDFLNRNGAVERVTIVCYDTATYQAYLMTLQELGGADEPEVSALKVRLAEPDAAANRPRD